MGKIKLNMTGVESFVKCAEGQHKVKVKSVEEITTQGGDDGIKVIFEVTAGDSIGATVQETFTLIDKALWKLKAFLEAINIKADGKIVIDTDKLVGRKCIVDVFHEDYNGKNYAHVDTYKKIVGKAAEETPDDEEDDEEEEKPAKGKKPAAKNTKKPVPEPEDDDEDEDEDDEDEEDEEPVETAKQKKARLAKEAAEKAKKAAAKGKTSSSKTTKKSKDEDEEDDEEWEEA